MNDEELIPKPQKEKNIPLSVAKRVALIAICTALISGGKFALSAIANVEVVTLLCALFGYIFGVYGVISTILFVAIEPFIWGFGTWLIYYFIYFPLVACIFMLLGKKKVKNVFLITMIAVILTTFFGVFSSLVDVGLFMGKYDNFFKRFAIYYSRGTIFYIVHIVCNLVTFSLLFTPLRILLEKIKKRYYM